MKDFFTPDYMFASYREITPEFLRSIGIRALLIDIDNTLAPYEQPEPDEAHFAWFRSMREAGVAVALISNNRQERVTRFNHDLGLTAFPESRKPHRKMLQEAMKILCVPPDQTAVLGDQLLTDAYAGKHIGLPAIIVPPIKDKTTLFFRAKRLLERPFIRKFAKRNGYAAWMSFWKIRPPKQVKTNERQESEK